MFVEIGDAETLAEPASDVEDLFQSQLLERKLSSKEIDKRINAKVAPLTTQLETLIQSVKELSERSSNRSADENVASERSKLSGASNMVTAVPRELRFDWPKTKIVFDERPTQHRYRTRSSAGHNQYRRLHCMDRDNATDGDSVDYMVQVRTATTRPPDTTSVHHTCPDETVANPNASFLRTTGEVQRIRALTLKSRSALAEQSHRKGEATIFPQPRQR